MEIPESEADWRYAVVGRVKGDQAIWGRPVKDRTLLWLTTVTERGNDGTVSFPTPSPAALAFSLGFESARAARALKDQVKFVKHDHRREFGIEKDQVPTLYAFFEQSMSAAVFSFQCLEAYANQVIANGAKEPMKVPRRRGDELLSPDELERSLSTDEKLTFVLPRLLSVKSPKGTKVWPPYRALKEIRDSTVHLKSIDQYVRGKLDRQSVYHRLLNRDPLEYPKSVVKLVRHFCQEKPDRWLEGAEARLSKLR